MSESSLSPDTIFDNLKAAKLGIIVIEAPNLLLETVLDSGYEAAFPNTHERESRGNISAHLDAADAHNRELWVAIRNEAGNIAIASNGTLLLGSETEGVDGTFHGNYTFANADRTQGIEQGLERIIALRDAQVQRIAKEEGIGEGAARIVTFSEQEDPLKMTPQEYVESSTPPIHRRNMMEDRYGTREILVEYTQPALGGEGQEPVRNLSLCAVTDQDNIPKALVEEHLTRLFIQSYPDGTSLDHPDLTAMKASLEAIEGDSIHVLPKGRYKDLAKTMLEEYGVETIAEDGKGQIKQLKDLLKGLPAEDQAKPLGDLFPETTLAFYGDRMEQAKNHFPETAQLYEARKEELETPASDKWAQRCSERADMALGA